MGLVTRLIVILFLVCQSSIEKQPLLYHKSEDVSLLKKVKSDSTDEVVFNKETVYRSTDEVMLGQIAAVTVDDHNQLYIADGDQVTIHLFNQNGSYLRSFGRQGKGPGEFTAMYEGKTFIKPHSDQLYVADFMQGNVSFPHRVHVFSLDDFSFSHTIKLIPENKNRFERLKEHYPTQIFPRNDGTFLVSYHRLAHDYQDEESFIQYVLQDSTATILSGPVLELKDLRYLTYEYSNYTHMHSFPFFEKFLFAVSSDDRFYAANTGEFKIDVYDPNGEQVQTIKHPFDNVELNVKELLDKYEETNYMEQLDRNDGDQVALKMIRDANNLPENWPALESLIIDDEDRLWISTIIEDDEVYEWWILETTGEVISRFVWLREETIEVIRNGKLYSRKTDEETGLEEIVRYDVKIKQQK